MFQILVSESRNVVHVPQHGTSLQQSRQIYIHLLLSFVVIIHKSLPLQMRMTKLPLLRSRFNVVLIPITRCLPLILKLYVQR
jgi:hypothetical protein